MSLNKWILGKVNEKKNIITIELKKLFLRKDGKEFKFQKTHIIETLVNEINKKLKIDKDDIKKSIDDLIANGVFTKDRFGLIYYKRKYTEKEFMRDAIYFRELYKIQEMINKGE